MADVMSDSEESGSSRSGTNDWELVSASPRSASTPQSGHVSSAEPCGQGYGTVASDFVQMNYFAVSSADSSPYDATIQPGSLAGGRGDTIQPSSVAGVMQGIDLVNESDSVSDVHTAALPASAAPELDWMEPSSPHRSCVLATDEDEGSNSTNFSDDFKERTEGRSSDIAETTVEQSIASASSCADEQNAKFRAAFHGDLFAEDFFRDVQGVDVDGLELLIGEATAQELSASNGCEDKVWWKRHFGAWLAEAGQANSLWSMAFAAAVVGLILLGHGWQRLRKQNQKLRLQLFAKDKKVSQLLYQLIKMKESASNSRRIPVIKAQASFHGDFDHM